MSDVSVALENALHTLSYEEMVEFIYCVYPDSLKPISGKIAVTLCSYFTVGISHKLLAEYIFLDGSCLKKKLRPSI
jgi:hypothetical protein